MLAEMGAEVLLGDALDAASVRARLRGLALMPSLMS